MIDLAFAKRLCALAAAAVLLATAAIAEPEPSWEVFDDREDRTTPPVADAMLKLANVTATDFVYDLGCEWTPDRAIYVYDKEWGRLPLYLWIVPARIAGNWQLSVDGAELSAEIKQTYQRFHGSAFAIGRKHRIRNGRLDGARVTFELAMASGERKHYSGIATSDGVIEGRGWRARRKP